MTCTSPGSLRSWANHIDGSVALINLRGADLLKSEYGYAIFTQARSHIVSRKIPFRSKNFPNLRSLKLISCYQRETRVPPTILALSHQLSQTPDLATKVANDLLDFVSQLCELRASIKDGTITSASLIVSSLLQLDDQLLQWASARSSRWSHTLVFDSNQPDNIYDDSYAIYQAYWIAGTWNLQRTSRIFVHESILLQLDKLLLTAQHQTWPGSNIKSLLHQRTKSLAVILETSSEICASVPYLLGHDRTYDEQLTNPAPAASGYFLLPSLFLAGSTIGIPTNMRVYALGRLKYVGHKLGIHQALLLARTLEAKMEEGAVEGLLKQSNRGMCEGSWGGVDGGIVEDRLFCGDDNKHTDEEEFGGRFARYMGNWETELGPMVEMRDEMVEVI